jgi:hypothetical protein
VDREQRAVGNRQRHQHGGGDDAANEIESHRPPPGVCVCGGRCGGRVSSGSGRYGTAPVAAPVSMMIFTRPVKLSPFDSQSPANQSIIAK